MQRQLTFKIHHTGSSGNCATIYNKGGGWNMMVDAGKSYKTIEKHLFEISFIFYTHRHS